MKTERSSIAASTISPNIKRILVPVDFSGASNNAAEYARHIGGLAGADLIFLHIIVPDAPLGCTNLPATCADELKENAEESLRALVRTSRAQGDSAAKSITRSGLPAQEIVEEAKESDVDLIVIATHGYTGWKHFCIGSTAERVVRAAPCPVLVVREKQYDLI